MILIVDMNSTVNPFGFYEFVRPIVSVVKPMEKCRTEHFTKVGAGKAGKYDKVILSGTALMDSVATDAADGFGWLRGYEKPVLGICAGMQVIGMAFGSRLVNCGETGMTRIKTVSRNPLFSGRFGAYALHRRAMKPSSAFEVLAKSAKCVEAVKHWEKEIYGVLFHPEVRNQEIIRDFVSL